MGGALSGAAAIAAGALPAWARPPITSQALRSPDSLPYPRRPMGARGSPAQIDNVVILMLENHSFDNILGMLPYQVGTRRGVDGLPGNGSVPTATNPDRKGHRVRTFHLPDLCPSEGLTQSWDSSHMQYDGGRNDGFVRVAGSATPMGYFDKADLPVSYALAGQFPISERYFCSTLGQTEPNRRFLFAGTASGTISDSGPTFSIPAANGTIFDRLDAARVNWLVYFDSLPSPFYFPNVRNNPQQVARCVKNPLFFEHAAAARLPSVSVIEENFNYQSEENPQDVGYGESFLRRVAAACMASPQWRSIVLFVTYDEHGGFYDHVAPPRAIPPDDIQPILDVQDGTFPAGYDRYGFRVPLTVISPWSRPNYVSRRVADHTSILSFIEHRWNLPGLTRRDANAWALADMLDTRHPHFLDPPGLPRARPIDATLARCRADGRHPPGPPAALAKIGVRAGSRR
jgi:phospholipase C